MPPKQAGPAHSNQIIAHAIARVSQALPDADPYRVWQSFELQDESDGRRREVPLLILAQNGLWVVDVQPYSGRLLSDGQVWLWVGREEHLIDSPFLELDDVAIRLKDALRRRGLRHVPVHTRVLLANPNVALEEPEGFQRLEEVVSPPEQPGPGLQSIDTHLLDHPEAGRAVAHSEVDAIFDALSREGLQEARFQRVVGPWRLGQRLSEHDTWQEHEAQSLTDGPALARVRTWVLPRDMDQAGKDALRRAARREAEVLGRLGQHPHILELQGTVEFGDHPHLIFEHFPGGQPLNRFLRNPKQPLSFDDRLDILQQVAEALDHCHRHEVTHRNLSPDSVLVRRGPEGRLEVRLHRFEGAVARRAEATTLGTRHMGYFSERIDDLYRAPEVERDPDAADPQSDLFSLGAVAWFLFAGRHPAPSLTHRNHQLREDEGLRLWRARDDFDQDLVEAIAAATREKVTEREEAVVRWAGSILGPSQEPDIRSWINALLARYRQGLPEGQVANPQRADPGQLLGEGLEVLSILGSGASARVLKVMSDGRPFALKVPHKEGAEALLEAEAQVLARIDHPNVVKLEERLTLSGVPCLLMEFAGEETLWELVQAQGSLALDYVQRLGDDLLQALSYLHERGITHRDIKPTNLAFTTAKNRARRLLIFDFSLAALPPSEVMAGTPRWRDPTLDDRGLWDPAADLYAAGAVLHYALTGERPRWDDREQRTRISISRFDPDLRGALTTFFERALHPDVEQRYGDAREMASAWEDLFAAGRSTAHPVEAVGPADPRLERAGLDTPIGALGLSVAALNALERAGVADVRDFLGLPRNRLSLVRGVGRQTRGELSRAAERLHERLGGREDAAVRPFLPGATLLPLALPEAGLGLGKGALEALMDGGIRTVRDLAETDQGRVERLLARHQADLQALARALGAHAAPIKGPIGDWVSSLLSPNPPSKRTQWEQRCAALFGLTDLPGVQAPPGGRTNAQVSQALELDPRVFRVSFASARSSWARNAAVRDAALAAVGEALDRVGPVAPIPEVAGALVEAHAPQLRGDEHALRQAIALVRFATDVHPTESPLVWRIMGGKAWVAQRESTLDLLQSLGRQADRLAAASGPTPLEVGHRELSRQVAPPLATLPPELLVQRAVAASEEAALSPRLEIYPRGMAARRAIELSAAMLTPGLGADEIRKRVATRYPEAEALPTRPALDSLLRRVGLTWSSEQAAYIKPGSSASSLTATEFWRTRASTSMVTGEGPVSSAHRFDATLERSRASGRFRVLQVGARRTLSTAALLVDRVPGLSPRSLEKMVMEGLEARIKGSGADRDFIFQVDRLGPSGEHWPLFVDRFIAPVVEAVIEDILSTAARRRPQLLLHPGLLARYGLSGALETLVSRAEAEEGQGIWLLLPSWDDGAKPRLHHPHGDLPIPIYKPAQQLRVPRSWIRSQPQEGP